MAPKFKLKKDKQDLFYFTLHAGNGQVIATSEKYTTKAALYNGVASVQKNAYGAVIDDLT